jgi:hypothetical protein
MSSLCGADTPVREKCAPKTDYVEGVNRVI